MSGTENRAGYLKDRTATAALPPDPGERGAGTQNLYTGASMNSKNRSTAKRIFIAACIALASGAGAQGSNVWMRLFDTKDFEGWQGRITDNYWKVTDTAGIVGTHPAAGTAMNGENTFLFTDSAYSDFHLKLEGRMPGSGGYRNSGIMWRSTIVNKTGYAAMGYQYEISDGGTGAFYHERGTELGFTGGCKEATTATAWKKMEIIADGPKGTHLLNGKSCFTYATFKVTTKGYIGLQLHAPGDFAVNFRNIYIQPVNSSFQIPADNAYDSTGQKIGVIGIHIVPKAQHADPLAALTGAAYIVDARGRVLALPESRSGATRLRRNPGTWLLAR